MLGRIVNLALSIAAPTANRFYTSLHGPIAPGLPHPSEVRIETGREVLWVNLGYWRDVALVDETNVDRAEALLESAQREMARLLARTAKLSSGDDVLDCGFGYGDQDILWADEFAPKSIRGLNVTELQVKVARERVRVLGLDRTIDLMVGSATEMPIESASADVVFALECAFHFKTRKRFFEEAFRVLRPGGRIVLVDWLRKAEGRPSLLEAQRQRSGRRLLFLPEENVCSPRVYEETIRAAGFTDVSLTEITEHVFRPFWRAIAAITHKHAVDGDSKFPFLWQGRADADRPRDVSIARVRQAASCDFDRLVWPQWLGIDEYALVAATKPAEASR
jgi:ubiquinone/menaquinone biosynthesis C-methylase UbiE